MSLLTPDLGLIFWMTLSFGIVLAILTKYGFPIILRMVEDRNAYIEESLVMAEKARTELEMVKKESITLISEAHKEQREILKAAIISQKEILREAKEKAQIETENMIRSAHLQINYEREEALRDIRRQIADLSVDIASKVLRQKLAKKGEQMDMIERLIDEVNNRQS
jgi:F-type H+-transporting ATPase subunit b